MHGDFTGKFTGWVVAMATPKKTAEGTWRVQMQINGQRLLTYAQFLAEPAAARHAVLAIASGGVREKLAQRCTQDGVRAWGVAAANVVRMDAVALGEGAILSPFVTLTSNIRIGRHFHANINSYVEHDLWWATLSPLRPACIAMATWLLKTTPT